jgi:RNA polymerase subunit RPABC4/transcription elongation factor Spt4
MWKGTFVNDLLKPILTSAEFKLGSQLCLVFLVVFWLAIVFWTWRDARRRGAMSWFWAIVVALFFPLLPLPGWVVYMVVRPPEYEEDARERELEIRAREAELARESSVCPSCLKAVEPDYLICPYCMKKLKKECGSCGRALKMSWAVCPYCKTKQVVQQAAEPAAAQAAPVPAAAKPAAKAASPAKAAPAPASAAPVAPSAPQATASEPKTEPAPGSASS